MSEKMKDFKQEKKRKRKQALGSAKHQQEDIDKQCQLMLELTSIKMSIKNEIDRVYNDSLKALEREAALNQKRIEDSLAGSTRIRDESDSIGKMAADTQQKILQSHEVANSIKQMQNDLDRRNKSFIEEAQGKAFTIFKTEQERQNSFVDSYKQAFEEAKIESASKELFEACYGKVKADDQRKVSTSIPQKIIERPQIPRDILALNDYHKSVEVFIDVVYKNNENFELIQENILEKYGAILDGHFKLTSGLHSNRYIQCAQVFQNPKQVRILTENLKYQLEKRKLDKEIQTVIGPAIGGIIFAYELSKALGARNIYAERVDEKMTFRRGFYLEPGEKVVVVEDVVTTGGSAKEVAQLAQSMGAEVVAVCSLVDRSGGKVQFDWPFVTLIKMDVVTYQLDNCPLCKEGKPLTQPGSRHLKL